MALFSQEKRQSARIKFSSPLRYQIRGNSVVNNAIGDNVSLGGMAFITDAGVPRLSTVMLEFNVLSQIIKPVGKIIRSTSLPYSDRYQLGIEFIEIDPIQKDYLDKYLKMIMQAHGG
ncbi:MAG: PilZ domain-containing protein [Candidatus Omnitrophota bacterium]|jgi:c-di-GMP-binding flagellar brake protein YcgR